MDKLTLSQVVFCNLVWIIAFLVCLPSIKKHSNTSKYFFLWLFISLYSTFEFSGGDFYHYKYIYDENILSLNENIHIEYFYFWLTKILPENYFLWRFFVWGLAGLFWVLTIKKLKQDSQFASLIFLLIVFFLFVGARQALCFSIIYYALTLYLYNRKESFLIRLFALFLFISSYFLHKTSIIYILISLFALCPIGKKTILWSLILFPLLYKSFDFIAYNFINEYSTFDLSNAEVMERYMQGESQEANIYGLIRIFLARIPIFLLLGYAIWHVFFKRELVNKVYLVFLRCSYILIYISYLFIGRDISKFIAPRFWGAALFPLTLFVTGYMYKYRNTRYFLICTLLLTISMFYTLSYAIYKLY